MIVRIKTFSGETLYLPEEDYLEELMYSNNKLLDIGKPIVEDVEFEEISNTANKNNVINKNKKKFLERFYENGKLTKAGKWGVGITAGTALAGGTAYGVRRYRKKNSIKK